ncbi:MAG: hypothetical protein DRJ65_02045 [Acidobacteria bacterium]|nr:MAG: hypothetical protein DRJ65_02045 [Acidobacteriota bacterium]
MIHKGGCHCGAVKFEVEAPEDLVAELCNCSICSMTSYLHLIVPKNCFRLVAGQEALETYTFNTGVAQHHFCRHCGIKSFYVPRSNPDGISVNVRCLLPETISSIQIRNFDGRNWELNAHELAHLSAEDNKTENPTGVDEVDVSAVDLEEAVVLRTFSHRQEADLAIGYLHSCGIPAIVTGDDCGGLRPELSQSLGVRILVSPDHQAEADRLLEEIPDGLPG